MAISPRFFAPPRTAQKRGLRAILDPVIDPIHFGFAESLSRYREMRARLPEAEMLMGTGNLTELTDADSVGVTALLLGICSELAIANVLTVHVSPHTRRTIEEHDAARRIMYAARGGPQPAERLWARARCRSTTAAPFPYSGRGDRGVRRASEGRQLPHRGGRGRNSRLQPRRPFRRPRTPSRCSTSSGSKRTARTHSISAPS